MKPEYEFTKPLPIVGTKEYFEFRKFMGHKYNFSTRMHITTLKNEYLIEYWNDFLKIKDQSINNEKQS
jgi:hypothetical protein